LATIGIAVDYTEWGLDCFPVHFDLEIWRRDHGEIKCGDEVEAKSYKASLNSMDNEDRMVYSSNSRATRNTLRTTDYINLVELPQNKSR
jgi:hypothetical protein